MFCFLKGRVTKLSAIFSRRDVEANMKPCNSFQSLPHNDERKWELRAHTWAPTPPVRHKLVSRARSVHVFFQRTMVGEGTTTRKCDFCVKVQLRWYTFSTFRKQFFFSWNLMKKLFTCLTKQFLPCKYYKKHPNILSVDGSFFLLL